MFSNKLNIILITFVFLVLLIPFLEFITFNLNIINERTDLKINSLTLKRLLPLYILFSFLFLICFLILKKKTKFSPFNIIIYLSLVYWIFFKYNDFKKFFDFKPLNQFDGILALILSIIVIFVFTILFFKKKTNYINIFISIFLILNFIYLSSVIYFKNNLNIDQSQDGFKYEQINIKNSTRNNIYLVITDAMPPIEIADKILISDSNKFLNRLKSHNFNYIKNSRSLYGNTYFTIGSIFNLKPLEKKDPQLPTSYENLKHPKLTFPTVLRKNNLSNLEYNLNKLGYDIKWIGSHFSNCYGYNRSYCIDAIDNRSILINYENLSFLKKTPIIPITSKVLKLLNIDIEEKIIFKSNNAIQNFNDFLTKNGKPKKPTFVFIHHLISHWPYLVDEECNFEKNFGKQNKTGIKKAFECNKKLISELAIKIINFDKDAIVLIQSDHNWELSNYDSEQYGGRREIFNLIKTNSSCREYENFAQVNINAIRLALYCATNTKPHF